jgi:hypothetical protein
MSTKEKEEDEEKDGVLNPLQKAFLIFEKEGIEGLIKQGVSFQNLGTPS